jgi:hypothetical protein
MNFLDFSEARDLFVNIFQILRSNCKILGLRVHFGETEGPKCKMSEIPRITNYFSMDKGVDRVHQSSPTGAQKRERSTGSSARASPDLGPRRGDRATAVARRGHGKLGGEGFRCGRGEEKGTVRCGVLRGSSGWLL